MKRREFSLSAAVTASALALPAAPPALAQVRQFMEGKDFKRLDPPVKPDAPAGKVEVLEFFWYYCPHCHDFEPMLQAWIKAAPKDRVIRRVPIAFQASYVPQQKLFYALEAMGKIDELHAKVFRTIHVEKKPLGRDEEILAWVGAQGVNAAKFKEIYNSFNVANKVRHATQLQDSYAVEGVPSMGVAGRYYVDAGMIRGGMPAVLQAVEYLITTIRKG
ncbi:thiol:disulfide interchange protein DsbA/DsbL [Verminephrobacter aporrectodeae subsp. tuberculatae]|uniref:thiol:disulfide interchange protein DsbA/DsbL n=1 Tax=Verminephrobacter aporrectodeae TaxID=1110389 RepID=UPI002238187C|nr:thiol:disulfide interchange protein DsbA/DsbL [Verminephrobacter aporrectodeae]MCW5256547.1 thiol:disulfide interchange protein DsbA/DsbL [Verminephrobacter aporrectodeae subsp. tuberculatae]MCW8207003.1 thiol:disulfide interchange protein DsbA/DsbL [Verminephrobacter aporrectodeae subsp. tuberculatae]